MLPVRGSWQVSESAIQLYSKATSNLNRQIKSSHDILRAVFTSSCSFDLICFPASLHLESLKANEPVGVIKQGELEQPSVITKTNGKRRSFAGNISHGSKRLCRSFNSAALRLFWHLFIVPFKCKCLGSITINETVVFTDCIQRLLELRLLHLHNLHLLQAQEYSFCCFSVASEGGTRTPPLKNGSETDL